MRRPVEPLEVKGVAARDLVVRLLADLGDLFLAEPLLETAEEPGELVKRQLIPGVEVSLELLDEQFQRRHSVEFPSSATLIVSPFCEISA
jgi:hypothetical protein